MNIGRSPDRRIKSKENQRVVCLGVDKLKEQDFSNGTAFRIEDQLETIILKYEVFFCLKLCHFPKSGCLDSLYFLCVLSGGRGRFNRCLLFRLVMVRVEFLKDHRIKS